MMPFSRRTAEVVMKKYFMKHRFLLIFVLLSLLLVSVFFVSYSLFVGWVTASLIGDEMGFRLAITMIVGFLVSSVLILVFQLTLINKLVARIRLDLQRDVAIKLMRSRENVSDVLNIYNQEIDMVLNGYIRNIPFVINLVLSFIVATTYAAVLSWQITIIFVGISIIAVIFNQLYKGKLSSALEEYREKNTRMNAALKGFFSNTKMLNIFQANSFAYSKIDETFVASDKAFVRNQAVNRLTGIVNQSISNLMSLSLIVIGFWFVSVGTLTVGAVMALLFLMPHIASPFYQIMGLKNQMDATKEVRARLNSFVGEQDGEAILELGEGEIKFVNVDFSYTSNDFIKNLTFTFQDKKKYLIIGESGSGKSTLLNLMLKDICPVKGQIEYCGLNLKDIPKSSWHKIISYVSQNIEIVPGTLIDNIVLSDNYDEKSLSRIISTLNLGYLSSSLGDELEEDLSNFSGGELQRIAIARMLYKDSYIMIFDELSSALDPKNAFEIEDYLTQIEDKLLISVSHRINKSLLNRYDKIMLIKNGEIAYFGSYEDDSSRILEKYINSNV